MPRGRALWATALPTRLIRPWGAGCTVVGVSEHKPHMRNVVETVAPSEAVGLSPGDGKATCSVCPACEAIWMPPWWRALQPLLCVSFVCSERPAPVGAQAQQSCLWRGVWRVDPPSPCPFPTPSPPAPPPFPCPVPPHPIPLPLPCSIPSHPPAPPPPCPPETSQSGSLPPSLRSASGGFDMGPRAGQAHTPCALSPTCSVQGQLSPKPPSRDPFPSFSQREAVSGRRNRVSVTETAWLEVAATSLCPGCGEWGRRGGGMVGWAGDTQGHRARPQRAGHWL